MITEPNGPGWRSLAVGLGDLPQDEDAIIVDLGSRSHRVDVVHREGVWELSGMVCRAQDLEQSNLSAMELWRINAQRCLTSYVIETDGSVWVTALAPVPGLTAEEFGWLARLVASEADQLEYRLTGKDSR